MSRHHPWSPFYWDDWATDTAHLNHMEYSIYHRLLTHYYKSQKPILANAVVLPRLCLAVDEAECLALASVLSQFFELRPDGYHNRRADYEIEKSVGISNKRSLSGRKGGIAKVANATVLSEQKATQPQPQPQEHLYIPDIEVFEEIEKVVLRIGQLHPANAHRRASLITLPPVEATAIYEATRRHSPEAVIEGTRNYAAAVEQWPVEGRDRRIKGVVRFYNDSDYMKDPRVWMEDSVRSNGNGKQPAVSAAQARPGIIKQNIIDGITADARRRAQPDSAERESGARRGVGAGN